MDLPVSQFPPPFLSPSLFSPFALVWFVTFSFSCLYLSFFPKPKPTDSVKKSDAVKSEDGVAKKMHDSDSDAGSGSDDEDKLKEGGVSKKKLRKLNRLSVAELKQLVKKPEVVEVGIGGSLLVC